MGIFNSGDDAVGVDADEGNNRRSPAFNFGLEPPATGAEFVVGEFIGTCGGTFDDIGDAKPEVEKKRSLKRRKESRGETPGVEGGPESVAGPAEMAADGGGVKTWVDAGEKNDKIFGDQIGNNLIARGQDLDLGGFPWSDQRAMHKAASSKRILRQRKDFTEAVSGRESDSPLWEELSMKPMFLPCLHNSTDL
jgi:hypothetical protein